MNRCSKLSRYVYEYQMLLSGEFCKPKKLASVVMSKTHRALGIAVVGFVGDHLKDKKVTEFNTLD